MNIVDATARYERWARRRVPLIRADLARKHREMAAGPFELLRATYYRWAQVWPEAAGKLFKAPSVLSVGDLHVENFGTWRDAEGRLAWGINDFDEADRLPLTNDLTRLCVSAIIAIERHELPVTAGEATALILEGYRAAIKTGGMPFVLEEHHRSLREIAYGHIKDSEAFWGKMTALRTTSERLPRAARRMLARLLPEDVKDARVVHRVAGLGSLGRRRFAAIGELDGGLVAREVKELLPPATVWALREKSVRILYSEILEQTIRCPDPFLVHRGRWVGRRLSPANARIELEYLRRSSEFGKVLQSMGFETANVHLGGRNRKRLRAALGRIKDSAFTAAIRELGKIVLHDWKDWKRR